MLIDFYCRLDDCATAELADVLTRAIVAGRLAMFHRTSLVNLGC